MMNCTKKLITIISGYLNEIKVWLKGELRPIINWERYYRVRKSYNSDKEVFGEKEVVFMVDGLLNHGGLSDRFNGIISTYAICKCKQYPFRISWTYPFRLDDYLNPNEYDWSIDESSPEVVKNQTTRALVVLNDPNGRGLLNLKLRRQTHVYANMNLLSLINKKYHTEYKWHELFQELFKPVEGIEQQLKIHTERISTDYIGVVFRFQQLLGDFKEGNYPTLNQKEREKLIKKCLDAVKNIRDRHNNYAILVTSDSKTFLKNVELLDKCYIIPGEIVHIMFTRDASFNTYMKSFIDFFMLSKAKKVYSVVTSEMTIDGHLFFTTFPEFAAKSNNVPFERIIIE